MEKVFKLNEIDCAVCAAKAEKRVSKGKGVTHATVDFMTQRLFVEAQEMNGALIEEIKAAVRKIEPDCEVTEV